MSSLANLNGIFAYVNDDDRQGTHCFIDIDTVETFVLNSLPSGGDIMSIYSSGFYMDKIIADTGKEVYHFKRTQTIEEKIKEREAEMWQY